MAAVAVARGSSFMFSKQLLGSMEPLNLLGIRFLLAFFIMMLFFGRRVVESVREEPETLTAGALIGFAYYVVMALELNGLKYTTTATASFIENSAVVLVPVAEALLLKRLPSRITVICSVITLAGVGLIAAGGFGMGIGKGEIICIIVALVYTGAIIMTDRMAKAYDAFSVGIIYVGVMGALGAVSSAVVETPHLPQSGNEWLMLMMLVLVCSCFGFTMQSVAQEKISSETTGLMTAINPLAAAVLGTVFLKERMGFAAIIGAILIISGILIDSRNVKDS